MKFAASVSLAALALAGCAANTSSTAPVAEVPASAAAPAADALPYPQTPDGARQFIADAEKDLFDFSVIGSRAAWVNATYITEDTDALAAYFGTIGTEMGVRSPTRRRNIATCPASSPDTRRKLNMLRNGLTLAAPTTPGAAAELNRHRHRSRLRNMAAAAGRWTARRSPATRSRRGWARSAIPNQLREMWTSWHDNVGSPMRTEYQPHGRDRQAGRARARLSPTPARCGAPNTTCRRTNSRR